MNSLRFRLILGFGLIALVPLAIAIVLLTDRIEQMVRQQAADRLSASLRAITAQIASDERQTVEKVQILARDPELRRRYLVGEARRELAAFLEERRFLLGLDYLRIVDTNGSVRASASEALAPAGRPRRASRPAPAPAQARRGVTLRALEGEGGLALMMSAPIEYQGSKVGSVEGGFALDSEFLERRGEPVGISLSLRPTDGVDVKGNPIPPGTFRRVGTDGALLGESVPLVIGDPPYPLLVGGTDTADAEKTVTSLQWASAFLGVAALAVAIVLGIAWSRQISRPVERLASYSDRLARGEWDEPLTLRSVRELETLVTALDRMRRDLQSYRSRLVVSERQAAWSQMARKVAHEVKNPLTPIAISIEDLKRSYDARRPDFPEILDQAVRTIGEEVESLKRLLQEFSDFGRFPAPRIEPCRWAGLAADLEILYRREIDAGRLTVASASSSGARSLVFPADAGQIRQALVNLIQNGLDASPDGRVVVAAAAQDSKALLTVSDDGPGLDPEERARLFAPGFTTKPHGSGLGLTIVQRIVSEHEGTIEVQSEPGRGTRFTIRLPMPREAA